MIASAPGKVLWAGEYAVLDGHAAVIAAVDRRVVATLGDVPGELSPFLEAVRAELGDDVRRVRVDSSALAHGAAKLGLGSSAAAVVAATAAVLGISGPVDRARIHAVAHRAHARAQAPRGARGSGADIAASVHGGLLRVQRGAHADHEKPLLVAPIAANPPPHCLVWTGTPADTPTLVAKVSALRAHDPSAHAAAMQVIADAALDLAAALAATDATRAVVAIAAGAAALAALAQRSGAALVPPAFAAIDALAASLGGAAKPTGAGGGDLILCVFPDEAARDRFRTAMELRGMILVSANIDRNGVLADPALSA